MNGFFCVNKEFGVSSAKTIWQLKKKLNIKDKIGHMGTLDPNATGVLVVGVGRANRLFDVMLQKKKTYIATFEFGFETETLDLESDNIVKSSKIIPTKDEIEMMLQKMIGKQLQTAPMYSAKNINGTRAYMLARDGKQIDIKPHEIEIYSLKLLEQKNEKSFVFEFECSGGTYIRSICRDLAYKLNSCATMTNLIRTKCGEFLIENSKKVEEIEDCDIISNDFVIKFLPIINLIAEDVQKIKNGVKIKVSNKPGKYRLYQNDNLIGICLVEENGLTSIPTWLI